MRMFDINQNKHSDILNCSCTNHYHNLTFLEMNKFNLSLYLLRVCARTQHRHGSPTGNHIHSQELAPRSEDALRIVLFQTSRNINKTSVLT